MSSTRHGASLQVLLRQPEPTFHSGGAGEWDTGKRVFKCLARDADYWINGVLKLGTKDAVALAHTTGGVIAGYGNMYIVGHEVKFNRGDSATIDVNFQGLLGQGKIASVEYQGGTEQQTARVTAGLIYVPTRINVPKPRIVHTYFQLNGKPNLLRAGITKTPPGISAFDTSRLAAWYDDFTGDQTTEFENWVIIDTIPQTPGNIQGIPLVQVKDTYEWTVVRVPSGL